MAIARGHNLKVLEDSAEAIGAIYKGKRTGSIGDIGIFSFQPPTMMTSPGEGGGVITDDPVLYECAIRFHDLGRVRRTFLARPGHYPIPKRRQRHRRRPRRGNDLGLNYRMNEETGAFCAPKSARWKPRSQPSPDAPLRDG